MGRKSAQERREALRKRTQKSVRGRDKTGMGRSSAVDINSVDGVKFFKPQGGRTKNLIDIIPFDITQDWYPKLRLPSGESTGLEPGDNDYKLEIPVHRRVGSSNAEMLCLNKAFGKKCPICEELKQEYAKDKAKRDQSIIKELSPSWRDYYNVYDYNDDEYSGLKVWADFSYHLFEKFLMVESETDNEGGAIAFSSLEDGNSIQFKCKEKSLGDNTFFEAEAIEFLERDPYTDEILDESISFDKLLKIPTYDDVLNAHLDLDNNEEETRSTKDEEPVTRARPRPQAGARPRPKPEKPKDDEPPFDPDSNMCIGGGTFGEDCQKLPECDEKCNEDVFEACLKEANKKEEPVKETPASSNTQPKRATRRKPQTQTTSRRK